MCGSAQRENVDWEGLPWSDVVDNLVAKYPEKRLVPGYADINFDAT